MADPQMIDIASAELSATINPYGAELTALRDTEGRALMTDADPAYWTGHAPILFPVIGVTNGGVIRLDGTEFPMPKHGLARHAPFDVVARGVASVTLQLTDDEVTRAAYPFAFGLDLTYRIDGATIGIEAGIENRNDGPMPAQFGYHPAFAWPLPYGRARGDHRIVFAADEPARLRTIAPDGLIAANTRPSPLDGRTLHLADALFAHDALVWDPVESQSVVYGATDGPQLHIAFPDTPRLGIWTKPGAQFVCVEPWHGIADPAGFTGDFRTKPGVFEIEAGATMRIAMSVTLVP